MNRTICRSKCIITFSKHAKTGILIGYFLINALCSMCQQINIAVAANAKAVIETLGKTFTKETGIKIAITSSSSGTLATQIIQGAPFELFLSADMTLPELVYEKGLSYNRPVVYAKGKLILCSSIKFTPQNWKNQLISILSQGGHIAIANPKLAPYGKAATECLHYYGLFEKLSPGLIYGESISQVHLFLETGAVKAGFASASIFMDPQQKTKLYYLELSTESYKPILQGAIILKRAKGQNREVSEKFLRFLDSKASCDLFKKAGYL